MTDPDRWKPFCSLAFNLLTAFGVQKRLTGGNRRQDPLAHHLGRGELQEAKELERDFVRRCAGSRDRGWLRTENVPVSSYKANLGGGKGSCCRGRARRNERNKAIRHSPAHAGSVSKTRAGQERPFPPRNKRKCRLRGSTGAGSSHYHGVRGQALAGNGL